MGEHDDPRLGAIVVGSAGNDGDTPFVVGGPGAAAGAISVGDSYGGGSIFNAVRDPAARARLVAQFDLERTEPEWALGFRWDIVLGPTPMEQGA